MRRQAFFSMNSTTTPQTRTAWLWHYKWQLLISWLLLTVMITLSGYVIGVTMRPYALHGTVFEPPASVTDFTMTSSRTEEPVSLSDFQGKVVLIFFGYATCPDVCPTTLADYTQIFNRLGSQSQQAQLIWITVDPERDTPAAMEAYLSHFHPEFLGFVPTSEENLAEVAAQFYAYYEKQESGSQTGYLVDHTASLFLIDKSGQWRIVYPFKTPLDDLVADLQYLIEE